MKDMEQQTSTDKRRANLKPQWEPGQSGNPAGRPKNSVTTLLKNTDELTTKQIADKIIELAKAGEISVIKEYLDRTDGKVADKHLNLNVTITPESLQAAQERLLQAQRDTQALLKEYSGNNAT